MIRLLRSSAELAQSYLDFIEEMRKLGEKVWEEVAPMAGETIPTFLKRIQLAEPPAGSGSRDNLLGSTE
jgi:hypothetical protein